MSDLTDVFLWLFDANSLDVLFPAGTVVLPAGDILPEVKVLLTENALPR